MKKVLSAILAVGFVLASFACTQANTTTQNKTEKTRNTTNETTLTHSNEASSEQLTYEFSEPALTETLQTIEYETSEQIKEKILEEPLNVEYFGTVPLPEKDTELPLDGKHKNEYFDTEMWFFEFLFDEVDLEYLQAEMCFYRAPDEANYGSIIERYQISIEEFEAAFREYLLDRLYRSYFLNNSKELIISPALYHYKIWFEDDWRDNELFISSFYEKPKTETVCIRPEGDNIHSDAYFTIDHRLIDFVGKEKFGEFRDKYAGTQDFNILKFVDEFGITLQTYRKILKDTIPTEENVQPKGFCPDWIFPDEDCHGSKDFENEWTLEYRTYFRQKRRIDILNDPSTQQSSYYKKYVDSYGSISYSLIIECTGIDRNEIDKAIDYLDYDFHHLLTYADMIDLYSIDKKTFSKAVKKLKESFEGTEEEFIMKYGLCEEVDAWYSSDPANASVFLREGYQKPEIDTVMIRCKSDKVHRNLYYTIDRRLIEYVTPEKFKKFKDKYAGTEDFNILNFVRYFDVTKDEAIKIFYETTPVSYGPYPYDLNYLYGPENLCEKYFSRIIVKN